MNRGTYKKDKDYQVTVRLTEKQRKILEQKAWKNKKSINDFIRLLIDKAENMELSEEFKEAV